MYAGKIKNRGRKKLCLAAKCLAQFFSAPILLLALLIAQPAFALRPLRTQETAQPGKGVVEFGQVEPGEIYRLGNTTHRDVKNTMAFPVGSNVLVIEPSEGYASKPGRVGAFINRLSRNGCEVRIWDRSRASFTPDIVLLPHGADTREFEDKTIVFYDIDSGQNFNLYFYFGGEKTGAVDAVINEALLQVSSQFGRTEFNRSAMHMERANALSIPLRGRPRMQKFTVMPFEKDGSVEPVVLERNSYCYGDKLPEILRNAVVHATSVHNDDNALVSLALLIAMAKDGSIVHDVITNNSTRTVFPEPVLRNEDWNWYEFCRSRGFDEDRVKQLMGSQEWPQDFERMWMYWQSFVKINEMARAYKVIEDRLGIKIRVEMLGLSPENLAELKEERPEAAEWLSRYEILDGGSVVPGLPYIGTRSEQNKGADGEKIVSKVGEGIIRARLIRALEDVRNNKKKRLVVFLPLRDDAHYDHRAMHRVYMRQLSQLAPQNQDIDIIGVLAPAPWAGAGNAYLFFGEDDIPAIVDRKDPVLHRAQGNAIPASELMLEKFGGTPARPKELGGDYVEKVYIRPPSTITSASAGAAGKAAGWEEKARELSNEEYRQWRLAHPEAAPPLVVFGGTASGTILGSFSMDPDITSKSIKWSEKMAMPNALPSAYSNLAMIVPSMDSGMPAIQSRKVNAEVLPPGDLMAAIISGSGWAKEYTNSVLEWMEWAGVTEKAKFVSQLTFLQEFNARIMPDPDSFDGTDSFMPYFELRQPQPSGQIQITPQVLRYRDEYVTGYILHHLAISRLSKDKSQQELRQELGELLGNFAEFDLVDDEFVPGTFENMATSYHSDYEFPEDLKRALSPLMCYAIDPHEHGPDDKIYRNFSKLLRSAGYDIKPPELYKAVEVLSKTDLVNHRVGDLFVTALPLLMGGYTPENWQAAIDKYCEIMKNPYRITLATYDVCDIGVAYEDGAIAITEGVVDDQTEFGVRDLFFATPDGKRPKIPERVKAVLGNGDTIGVFGVGTWTASLRACIYSKGMLKQIQGLKYFGIIMNTNVGWDDTGGRHSKDFNAETYLNQMIEALGEDTIDFVIVGVVGESHPHTKKQVAAAEKLDQAMGEKQHDAFRTAFFKSQREADVFARKVRREHGIHVFSVDVTYTSGRYEPAILWQDIMLRAEQYLAGYSNKISAKESAKVAIPKIVRLTPIPEVMVELEGALKSLEFSMDIETDEAEDIRKKIVNQLMELQILTRYTSPEHIRLFDRLVYFLNPLRRDTGFEFDTQTRSLNVYANASDLWNERMLVDFWKAVGEAVYHCELNDRQRLSFKRMIARLREERGDLVKIERAKLFGYMYARALAITDDHRKALGMKGVILPDDFTPLASFMNGIVFSHHLPEAEKLFAKAAEEKAAAKTEEEEVEAEADPVHRSRVTYRPLSEYDKIVTSSLGSGESPIELFTRGLSGILEERLKQVKKGDAPVVWFDAGCGYGVALRQAKKRYPDLRTIGADWIDYRKEHKSQRKLADDIEEEFGSKEDVDIFKKKYDFKFFEREDADIVELPEGADVITAFQMLSYNNDQLGLIASLYNKLKPGGILIADFHAVADMDIETVAGRQHALPIFLDGLRSLGIRTLGLVELKRKPDTLYIMKPEDVEDNRLVLNLDVSAIRDIDEPPSQWKKLVYRREDPVFGVVYFMQEATPRPVVAASRRPAVAEAP